MADDPQANQPSRRIIRILGGNLEQSKASGAEAEALIAREGDAVAMTTIEAGYNRHFPEQVRAVIVAAISNGEEPLVYIDSHGGNDTLSGRHRIYPHAADRKSVV